MKIKSTIIGLALLTSITAQAQTNQYTSIFQPLFDASQWTFAGGYGHSISGVGRNLAFADVAYSFNQNVAVVGGVEDLWRAGGSSQFAVVKGGITLKTTLYPFKWTGVSFLANRQANPWAGILMSTPKNGNNVGTITIAGMDFDLYKTGQFSFSVDGLYENRSGQGEWDGNYVGGFIAVSRNKYTLQAGVGVAQGGMQSDKISGPQVSLSKTF